MKQKRQTNNYMKQIVFHIDDVPVEAKLPGSVICLTHGQTKLAINRDMVSIHTTDLTECSFALIDNEYDVYLTSSKGKIIKLFPGMDTVTGKDLKKHHNLTKLIVGGYFDEDLK